MNHTRRTLACLVTAVLALGPAWAASETATAQPVAAATASSSCSSESEHVEYDVYNPLIYLLHGIRYRASPVRGEAEAYNENVNAAMVLVSGLSEKILDSLAEREVQSTGPFAVFEKVSIYDVKDYLPEGEYDRLRKSGNENVLMIGALSFQADGDDPGLHSEPHALAELGKLRTGYPEAELKELTWVSERDYCPSCREQVCSGSRHFHSFEYGLSDAELSKRDSGLARAKSPAAEARIEKEYKSRADRRATDARADLKTAMKDAKEDYAKEHNTRKEEQKKNAAKAMAADPPATCPTTAPGAVNPASYTTATSTRADSCSSSPRPPGGLAKALANPAATPGGIDFSTLELRYLSDPGDGLRYAFHAEPGGTAATRRSATGERSVREASDSFFVWLSLPSNTFWVNLNPNEPDRIVDADLGRTDAGRILLQADLELKRTTARLIHPDSSLGRQFWNKISGACMSFRTWIVPEPAEVFDGDDELYIVDAPLSVQMESQYVASRGGAGAGSCGKQSANVEAWNEQVFRDLILPRIEKAVNENPEYAELRRVYLSRVAAEWYRERSQDSPTSYGDLVNDGDVSDWVTETDWKPKDTFDQYVRSYREGEFNISRQTHKGNYIETRTYIFGGVDFGSVELQRVSWDEAFDGPWAGMPVDTEMATETVVKGARGSHVWMGGDNTPYVVEPYSPPPSEQPDGGNETNGESGKGSDGKQGSTKASGEGVGEGRGPGLVVWLPLMVLAGFCAVLLLVGFAGRRGNTGGTEGSS
uniref:Uncharacterized protein n=1 Tax=Streptomyces sp. NBC_00093 TaxID=2975649 RepID=A0AAU2A3I9_9ACTN